MSQFVNKKTGRSYTVGASFPKVDARTVVAGLLHDGLDPKRLTSEAKREIRAAIDVVLEIADKDPSHPSREMLINCLTVTPSLMTGEQAIERLKEINVHVYRCIGM
jgi:hypothetical protein